MSSRLTEAFSILDLDAENDHEQIAAANTASTSASAAASPSFPESFGIGKIGKLGSRSDKEKKRGEVVENGVEAGNDVPIQDFTQLASEYKLPLVWIDLEMTGLNLKVDRILEIACIITDGNLTKSVEGPDLVIHQTKECMDKMGQWCQEHHAASGLTKRVLQSKLTEQDAEKQVIEFVRKHVGSSYTPLLAGNSVYVDYSFLKKYMQDLAGLFNHVLVDVSSVKALCIRWFPGGKSFEILLQKSCCWHCHKDHFDHMN